MNFDVNSYEAVIIIFPSPTKDTTLAIFSERAGFPEELRTFFIGPLTDEENRLFYILLRPTGNVYSPIHSFINRITNLARTLYKGVVIARLSFGNKETSILETTDGKIVLDEGVNTRLRFNLLEGTNKILKNQLDEMLRLRDKDILLAEALKNLTYLEQHKKILDAAILAGKELKDKGDISTPLAQRLIGLLVELENNKN